MVSNMNQADKIVRVILGVALLSLLVILDGGIRWIGLIGLVLVASVLMNWCPIYAMLGINSNKAKQ